MSSQHWIDYIVDLIDELTDDLGTVLSAFGHDPMPASNAAIELEENHNQELLRSAYSQGTLLIEAAMDHFTGFSRSITQPVLTIAPWTNVRGLIEAASVGTWLLDPQIEPSDRIRRSFQFRCKGLSEQVKFARASGDAKDTSAVLGRFVEVLEKAAANGLEVTREADGTAKNLKHQMPSVTDLVSAHLGEEGPYRLLSGVAHAHPWVLQQIGFRRADDDDRILLEKHLAPVSVAYLGKLALSTSKTPILHKCRLFGWPSSGITDMFHNAQIEFARVMAEITGTDVSL